MEQLLIGLILPSADLGQPDNRPSQPEFLTLTAPHAARGSGAVSMPGLCVVEQAHDTQRGLPDARLKPGVGEGSKEEPPRQWERDTPE